MNADVGDLHDGLKKGKFTSVDLVNFYGDRSQRLGR
jgi:hypothetical protein